MVCPSCDRSWDLVTGKHMHRYRDGKVVSIVTMVSRKCPECQRSEMEKKARMIEGERGVI